MSEPYDGCLCRLGLSLVTLLTSVDLLREVFSDLLRLLRLSLSRRVRFTNRFTEQAIDLHFRTSTTFRECHPWARHRVQGRQAAAYRPHQSVTRAVRPVDT